MKFLSYSLESQFVLYNSQFIGACIMKTCEASIHAIILAAGTSRRMGKPKQLLPFGDNSLLETVIRLVNKWDFSEVLTVIGREAEIIQKEIIVNDPSFRWIINSSFTNGQSDSLKKAMEQIERTPLNAMIFLGDLPLLKEETIQKVLNAGKEKLVQTSKPFVVRPKMKGKVGHPVFFGNAESEWFQQLHGDQGAKPIIKKNE
ncbi:nucleotidyltransferase family protein [Virgibacillus halophilus]|uniref:Nucleotidyltransferase family protein n=1 Tax=Tigheibacillus halophilus TaxID=361280 RepID=A0ABU5C3A8_9BACI|nr:nucleotidyltransferase family protein [Virgibacillus halophilus]